MIDQITTSGAMPALEMMIRFSAERQRIIQNNIANISTPDYRPRDVSVEDFQRTLREAVEARRSRNGGEFGDLEFRGTREVERGDDGRLELRPSTPGGILFHDRNDRDLERTMQSLVENASAFRVAVDLMRSRMGVMQTAISERV